MTSLQLLRISARNIGCLDRCFMAQASVSHRCCNYSNVRELCSKSSSDLPAESPSKDGELTETKKSSGVVVGWREQKQQALMDRIRQRSAEKTLEVKAQQEHIDDHHKKQREQESKTGRMLTQRHSMLFDTIPVEQRNEESFNNAISKRDL